MGLDQIIPVIFFLAVLILIIPEFLRSNLKSKQFFGNLFIWSIIVILVVVVTYIIY